MSEGTNLASHLARLAEESPSQPALLCKGGILTYRDLEARSSCCARGLKRLGIGSGSRVVLMIRPGPEFLVVAFALAKLGAVAVLVDPGIGLQAVGKCLEQAQPEVFIGIASAQAARLLFGWGRKTVRLSILIGRLSIRGPTLQSVMRLGEKSEEPLTRPSAEDPAAIVFTSGSTGPPKGVLYTHGMFLSQARFLRDHFHIQAGEIDLATFPLFALFDPIWRTTTIFPEMDFSRPGQTDPKKVVRCLLEHKVTHMFGSPALLDRVGAYARSRDLRFPDLKRVLCAGAPVSFEILECFASLLSSEAEIHTPYGATEALPVCSISGSELLAEKETSIGRGVCVGRPLRGVHLAVIKITDEPLPEWSEGLRVPPGETGELVVWGPNVSVAYFRNTQANALAKIRAKCTIRHRTGDLGYLDQKGRVWFCGRKSHRVITRHGTLFTVPCETVFNQHPSVRRSALVGIGQPADQVPVICIELKNKEKGSTVLANEILSLASRWPVTRPVRKVLFHPSFPVDARHNAKICREKLAQWASRQLE